jgi:adenosyl cobinamide kinase/adenosyl cobinamide phosphate guanylyltransferase
MALTLLVGGARSGKSSLAVDIGRRDGGAVTYIATAPVVDDDMRARISRHQAERPTRWRTIEETTDLAGALASAAGDLTIVDCLTLWVSNLMWDGVDDEAVVERATAAASVAARGRVVAVSNEVGLGVHPEIELARRYRDLMGRVNQIWASAASTSLLLVAGRALPLSDPWDHLEVPG